MIPKSQLQEFGFTDPEKFPRELVHHVVSLSLPSAMDQGMEPLEVIIENGLVVPLQASNTSSGMIIQNDGTMLYIGHRDAGNPSSPLESRFTKDIPYDMRIEVNNIMRRAVQADPTLSDIWTRIANSWSGWFPGLEEESSIQPAGEFKSIAQAWNKLSDLMGQMIDQVTGNKYDLKRVILKVIVQSDKEFKKGWLGEESVADEVTLKSIVQQGRVKYLLQSLLPKLQKVLKNPVFSSKSAFRIFYGSRRSYIIKLIVVTPEGFGRTFTDGVGVELTLADIDGFSPVVG